MIFIIVGFFILFFVFFLFVWVGESTLLQQHQKPIFLQYKHSYIFIAILMIVLFLSGIILISLKSLTVGFITFILALLWYIRNYIKGYNLYNKPKKLTTNILRLYKKINENFPNYKEKDKLVEISKKLKPNFTLKAISEDIDYIKEQMTAIHKGKGGYNKDEDIQLYYNEEILLISVLKNTKSEYNFKLYSGRDTDDYNIYDFIIFFVKRETNYNPFDYFDIEFSDKE